MIYNLVLALAVSGISAAPVPAESSTTSVDLFPLDIGFEGSTATAAAPFLVATDRGAIATGIPKSHYSYPEPVDLTVQSFDHQENDTSIFQMMGTYTPYFNNLEGWGVYNYANPGQCSVKQVHLLQRHGSRYPDSSYKFPEKLKNATDFKAEGNLTFLNDWTYQQGKNLLTKLGNNQLFNNGVKSFFRYGQLFDWENIKKIVTRSTTESRMTKSAEYFLSGFFGLDWTDYAELELLIEESGFNNTLAAWNDCTNNAYTYGSIAYPQLADFKEKYLSDAVDRFNSQVEGYNFTTSDLFEIQQICAYETNNLGFSNFCGLFSQLEWESYSYYQSIKNYAESSYGDPQGRALGVGWVMEFLDRLTNSTYDPSQQAEQNSTLDSNPIYFPLDQSFYFDFTHDSQIVGIITALGFEQFKANWTFEGPRKDVQNFDISKISPFGANLAFEIIECDAEVPVDRSTEAINGSSSEKYVHAILNDNTVSLSINIPEYCESRVDGWCKYDKFIEYLETLWDVADYNFSCDGEYNYTVPVTNGVPNT